ncbi:PAS domain-containing protein [Cytophagales bacterium LB-30]|uniref:PAS domain-containing protein n=1 Tax=Shiella aurantiaca TaxID=3058365 RepID=A0ABT8F4S1_9BACT|nr:GAF domain-containing protein [Shiella aurantiaca]MDN4165383.1 PAS domain-containing protein [Shiella aurantiaca]
MMTLFKNKKKLQQCEETTQQLSAEVLFATQYIQALLRGEKIEQIANAQLADSALIKSLQDFQSHLQKIEKEEGQRNWINVGLAKFANILRNDAQDLTAFYNELLAQLVKYVEANQGLLFLVQDEVGEKPYLESVACYAYDKRKYLQKRVEIGEGLAGQAYLEQDVIYLTDVPDRYTAITSGLGHATPRCVVIIPIMLNEKVFGILELASFTPLAPHVMEFLKKLSENIASVISATQSNRKTRELLEISQMQAESMRAQEEELRQNMEEMSAIQEDLNRNLEETSRLAHEVSTREKVFNVTTILSETDKFGTITFINDKFCEVAKYDREELLGKPQNIVRHPDMPRELFALMWSTIKAGKVFKGIVKNRAKDGSHYWVDAAIVPIFKESGELEKYIGARYHITDDALAEYLYDQQMKRLGIKKMEAHGIPLHQ